VDDGGYKAAARRRCGFGERRKGFVCDTLACLLCSVFHLCLMMGWWTLAEGALVLGSKLVRCRILAD